jgi:hypothetical protein
MRARITTVLSLTGVLVAGSAAALVNTQVLHKAGSSDSASAEVVAPGTGAPVDTNAAPSTSAAPAPVIAPTTTTKAPTPAAAPANTQATYQIGDAGTVALDTAGNVLTVVNATPNTGWTVISAQNDDPLNVEAVFQSATTRVEFHAALLFGVVTTSVESTSLETTTTGGSGGGTGGTTPPHHGDGDHEGGHDDGGHDGTGGGTGGGGGGGGGGSDD